MTSEFGVRVSEFGGQRLEFEVRVWGRSSFRVRVPSQSFGVRVRVSNLRSEFEARVWVSEFGSQSLESQSSGVRVWGLE